MTANIVLPPLDTWAKQHLTSLITAKSAQDFDEAFDNFIGKNVKVTFNGSPLSRDQYKKQLQGEVNALKERLDAEILAKNDEIGQWSSYYRQELLLIML